jgi:DNA-3-methyladenine glycosylase II
MATHRSRTKLPTYDTAEALRHLSEVDPKLGKLIARTGEFKMRLASEQSIFEALTEAIVYQQLHGKAAATIHGRMIDSFGGIHPSPELLMAAPEAQLRGCGLSGNKMLALRDLAHKISTGIVPTMAKLRRMEDEAIIEHLTQVRGIGRWTVEMMLIFRLGRTNILPVNDYGVRKGFAITFMGLKPDAKVTPDKLPTPEQMMRRAKKWKPWSSVATWYLWRACEITTMEK